MRAVNLLPKEVQRASSQKPVGPMLIGGGLLVVAMLLTFQMRSDANAQIADREALINEIAGKPVKTPPAVSPGQIAAAREKGPRITALDSALKTRVPWDNVLRQISLVIPEDVHLQTLNLKAPVAADAITQPPPNSSPEGVSIEGFSYSQDGVARLLSRLQVVPSLTNVQLASSGFSADDEASGTAASVVRFVINADIVPPAVIG